MIVRYASCGALRYVRYCALILALLVAVPAFADAQRSTMMGDPGRGQQRPVTARDLASLNPARVLLDRAKDLRLEPAQRARLDTIAKAHEARIAAEFRSVDSLRKVMDAVPQVGRGTRMDSARFAAYDAAVERAQAARRDILGILVVVKEEFDSTAARSLAVLQEEQRRPGEVQVERALRQVLTVLRSAR